MKNYNELFPDNLLKTAIEKRLNFLKDYIDQYFWLEDERHYSAVAILKTNDAKKINLATSGAGHLLFTGLVNRSRTASIVKRLFQNDMITPLGIRMVSSRSSYFNPCKYQTGSIWSQDNWIILQGLKYSGFSKEAKLLKEYNLNAISIIEDPYEYYSVDLENNIIKPEMLEIYPCMSQAWTAGAFIDIIKDKF